MHPLIRPDLGLIFWTVLGFLILFLLLKKFAWGTILNMIKDRESKIESSLRQAEAMKEEMKQWKSDNDELMKKAKAERDALLADAKKTIDKMYEAEKEKVQQEISRERIAAKEAIEFEKKKAMVDLKNMIGQFSIDIAEKLLQQELKGDESQQQLINKMVDDLKLN